MTAPQDDRLGQVTEVAEGVQVQFRRSWPDPIDDVWSALTENDRTARWFGTYEGERRVGGSGTLTMTHEEESAGEPMRIVECDPPRRLVVDTPGPEGVWHLDVTLTESGGGTLLRFRHRLDEGHNAGDIGPGWHYYLDQLSSVIAGDDPTTPWDDYYPAMIAPYASQMPGA